MIYNFTIHIFTKTVGIFLVRNSLVSISIENINCNLMRKHECALHRVEPCIVNFIGHPIISLVYIEIHMSNYLSLINPQKIGLQFYFERMKPNNFQNVMARRWNVRIWNMVFLYYWFRYQTPGNFYVLHIQTHKDLNWNKMKLLPILLRLDWIRCVAADVCIAVAASTQVCLYASTGKIRNLN